METEGKHDLQLARELDAAHDGVLNQYLLDIRNSYDKISSVDEREVFFGRLESSVVSWKE